MLLIAMIKIVVTIVVVVQFSPLTDWVAGGTWGMLLAEIVVVIISVLSAVQTTEQYKQNCIFKKAINIQDKFSQY